MLLFLGFEAGQFETPVYIGLPIPQGYWVSVDLKSRVSGYPPHLRPQFPCKYRALKIIAFLPTVSASYAISIRRASVLPSTYFRPALRRFHLTVDTLAVRLIVPLPGSIVDFHHQVIRPPPRVSKQRLSRHYAPCLAHNKKTASPFELAAKIITQSLSGDQYRLTRTESP